MTFPRDVVFDGIFRIQAPNETSIKKYDNQRNDNQFSVSSDESAQHQEKRQSIDQCARSDMYAVSRSAPRYQSCGKHQDKKDFVCYRSIEII